MIDFRSRNYYSQLYTVICICVCIDQMCICMCKMYINVSDNIGQEQEFDTIKTKNTYKESASSSHYIESTVLHSIISSI